MAYFIRADMADIRVSLDGIPQGGMWATYEGGALEADDQKTRPGGMTRQLAIGGPTSRGDVTVTTQFTDGIAKIAKDFEGRSGRGKLDITVTYMDTDGGTLGKPSFTRSGIVKSVQIPDVDVNTGDVAFLTVIGSMHEVGVNT
jgi:hypothetical protein